MCKTSETIDITWVIVIPVYHISAGFALPFLCGVSFFNLALALCLQQVRGFLD